MTDELRSVQREDEGEVLAFPRDDALHMIDRLAPGHTLCGELSFNRRCVDLAADPRRALTVALDEHGDACWTCSKRLRAVLGPVGDWPQYPGRRAPGRLRRIWRALADL
jgi:hypothetical protein